MTLTCMDGKCPPGRDEWVQRKIWMTQSTDEHFFRGFVWFDGREHRGRWNRFEHSTDGAGWGRRLRLPTESASAFSVSNSLCQSPIESGSCWRFVGGWLNWWTIWNGIQVFVWETLRQEHADLRGPKPIIYPVCKKNYLIFSVRKLIFLKHSFVRKLYYLINKINYLIFLQAKHVFVWNKLAESGASSVRL